MRSRGTPAAARPTENFGPGQRHSQRATHCINHPAHVPRVPSEKVGEEGIGVPVMPAGEMSAAETDLVCGQHYCCVSGNGGSAVDMVIWVCSCSGCYQRKIFLWCHPASREGDADTLAEIVGAFRGEALVFHKDPLDLTQKVIRPQQLYIPNSARRSTRSASEIGYKVAASTNTRSSRGMTWLS